MLNFSQAIRFGLLDTFTGQEIYSYYRHFKQSFFWSREKLIDYQNKQLRKLISLSYRDVPYYRSLFDEAGLKPDDINNIDDLKKIPVLTRELLRENFELLKTRGEIPRKVVPGSSSGTTGIPVKYIHDNAAESAGIAAGFALYNISGYTLGRRRLHIWGNPTSFRKWDKWQSRFKRRLINQFNYPAFQLNDIRNYKDLLIQIKRIKPEYIDGYTCAIGSFALWLRENDIKLKEIKAVFTTAENLNEINRDVISEFIGPVSDLYGCGEINGIAIQPAGEQKYYILESHVIVECQDFNGSCELIVTDLDNSFMPLIRYKIGDTVDGIYNPDSSELYPFRYFRKIDGRTSDYILLPGGKVIHPVNMLGGTFLRKFPQIKKHRVVWNGKVLNFEIEVSGELNLSGLESEIGQNLEGYDVSFTITVRDRLLPSANGKFRYVEILKPE